MVPMVKASKAERQVRLTIMQLKKNPKKEKLTFLATITSSKEENAAKNTFHRTRRRFQDRDAKKPPRCFPPRKEVDHESEL